MMKTPNEPENNPERRMSQELIKQLKNRDCFKLVCGAGNEDALEVEKLVAVYSKAGAKYFDLSAREDVVKAAKRAIDKFIPKNQQDQFILNVSVGMAGDPHVRKAQINQNCISCGICLKSCPQQAITCNLGIYQVSDKRCIGCGLCEKGCPQKAISFYTKNKDLSEVLPPLIKLGVKSIELHAVTEDELGCMQQWQQIQNQFDGILSLCIDRSLLGDKQYITRIKKAIEGRPEFSTIIQADGAPMSGSKDDYNTTLQAVAAADIVQKANLPVWIMLSGGTNTKTAELAKECGVKAHGVAIGSFARKIIRSLIQDEDLLNDPEKFEQAVSIAKELVDKTLTKLKDD